MRIPIYLSAFILICYTLLEAVYCRRHTLILKKDGRVSILCSQFGYLKGGILSVEVHNLDNTEHKLGFTLDKASNTGVSNYLENKVEKCMLNEHSVTIPMILLKFNFTKKKLDISRAGMGLNGVKVFPDYLSSEDQEHIFKLIGLLAVNTTVNKTIQDSVWELLKGYGDDNVNKIWEKMKKADDQKRPAVANKLLTYLKRLKVADNSSIPLVINNGQASVKFNVMFSQGAEGLFSLYFHNCGGSSLNPVNLNLTIIERNELGFLSAGDQPLPLLYFTLCGFYIILGFIWFYYLQTSKHMVFKIHYLMLTVLFTKATALVFHGIDYYVLDKHGVHKEGWAVMFYITHMLRGAVFFITIILIGAGWAFIKHMLSPREKKVFLVVIPLQVLANVATIMIEESEEGTVRYTTWKQIFILVDLICCAAILFPVIWSIRHLQEASQTDGKAAVSLAKLKLFRQFYIMVICYIYFTRIIVYLLSITIPFYLTWVVELFKEVANLVFFIVTGIKFRPAPDNPYLLVPADEDEEDADTERMEMEHVWSQSGITDGVTRIKHDRSGEMVDDEAAEPMLTATATQENKGRKTDGNSLAPGVPPIKSQGTVPRPAQQETQLESSHEFD